MKPLVAVLAGGSSSRMGRDKALVDADGLPMLQRVTAVGQSVGDVVVVGVAPSGGLDGIPDLRVGGLGPLAGLEAALIHAEGRDVILVAVDQPFVRADTLRRLHQTGGDAVVPVDGGWEQVTCAVYRKPCLPVVRGALDDGDLSILAILDRLAITLVERDEWGSWGEDGRSWFSVDTPDALAIGLERFGGR
jgi:molybdopterin-guanine dinucleotide biosynthesis protein A